MDKIGIDSGETAILSATSSPAKAGRLPLGLSLPESLENL